MTKKYNNIKSIILPHKKINIFVITIIFLGLTTGAIFSQIIGINDRNLVIEKIQQFINNINTNSLNSLLVFKNSIGINLLYIITIWILGMTLIGIIINIGILFLKGFIFGFSIASFIITYSYKGILLSLIYLIFGQLINIITVFIITIYSIMFSSKLFKLIFKSNNSIEIKRFLKNYLIILGLTIILSIISSLVEAFILPSLIKLIIKLYI